MSSPTVLIVDDRPDIRQRVGSFLHSRGYGILEAKNGAQAIETALTKDPDLILLDLRLPDIDGVDVARALHKMYKTGHIPIVGWTIDPLSKPAQKELLGAGFVDCLEKPISFTVLETSVNRFVPKSQQ